MTTPITLRDTIVTAIKEQLPQLRACEAHPGRFNVADLRKYSTQVPCVRVALLGIPAAKPLSSGEVECACDFAAFIFASGSKKDEFGNEAAGLATALIQLIDRNQWGEANAHPAKVERAENVFGVEIDKTATSMWVVTWGQVVRMGKDLFAPDGTSLPDIYVGMAPAIGTDNKDNYEQIGKTEAGNVSG